MSILSFYLQTRALDLKTLPVKPPLTHDHNHRRLHHVGPIESIPDYLDQQNAAGVDHPRFTLIAERRDQPPIDGSGRAVREAEPYEIDLIVADDSVRPNTSISDGNGNVSPASDYEISSKILLVAENRNAGDFALLVVSHDGVEGMAQRAGEDLMHVHQSSGGAVTVTEQEKFVPPADWTCGVGEDDIPDASSVQPGEASHRGLVAEADDLFGTSHRQDRDHHGHAHHGHHYHDHHHHGHDFNSNNILSRLQTDLKENSATLRKTSSSRRALYPTDNFPNLYSYEVDMSIEIDNTLVTRNGDLAGAVAFVNALVSVASEIFEKEVDTHREFANFNDIIFVWHYLIILYILVSNMIDLSLIFPIAIQ